MKCPSCGAELSEDTRFCSYCGHKIDRIANDVYNTSGGSSAGSISDITDRPSEPSTGNNANSSSEQTQNVKVSFSQKAKDKGAEVWAKMSMFGRISTISIIVFVLLCAVAFLADKTFAGVISLVQIAIVVVALLMQKGTIKSSKSWLKYIVLAVAIIITALNVMSFSWRTRKPSSAYNQPSSQPSQTTSQPAQTNESASNNATNFSIEKDAEYAYMSDEWNVYIATAISDSIIKIENWGKTLSSSKSVDYEYDIGTYKINECENGFSWVDDEHMAFSFSLQDKSNSRLKTPHTVVFTININDSDKFKGSGYDEQISCYSFQNDDWHLYRAIPLTEALVKIETWSRSSSADSFVYGYDVCVIDSGNTVTDFEWTDDERTAFTITMQDAANDHYWKSETFVAFTLENEGFTYKDVYAYLDSFVVGKDEAAVPTSASSYKHDDYQDVQEDLISAGFTNISTEILYDIVLGWTSEGEVKSVSIDGRTDYKQGDVFKKDAPIVITFHMKEEDDPAKQDAEITESPTTTPEETTKHTETPEATEDSSVVFPTTDSKLGKDFDSKGNSIAYYINVDGRTNVPKLADWGTAVVTDGVSYYLSYLESLGYTITVTGMDYREPYSGFHTYDTDFKVSNSSISWTMSLYIQDEDYVEYELDVKLP